MLFILHHENSIFLAAYLCYLEEIIQIKLREKIPKPSDMTYNIFHHIFALG